MSSLNVSDGMLDDIRLVLAKHDHDVQADPIKMLQYLSAVISVMASELEAPESQLRNLLQQLLQFTEQTFEQQIREKFPQVEKTEPVYGHWRPEEKSA